MNTLSTLILGRVLLALAFAGPGAAHLIDSLRQRNHLQAAIGAVEVLAGLALMWGWQVRWLALAAALFLVVDAFLVHAFWSAIPQDQRNQLLHFFKNVALAGAFLMLAAVDGQVTYPVQGA